MHQRTEEILNALIVEYIETATPVGSFSLLKEYNFPFSSATIRAEMASLEDLGFLTSLHTSSGRIPTEKGYRYYVETFTETDSLRKRETEAFRKRIISFSPNFERMLDMTARTMAEFSGNAGMVAENGIVYHSGIANLLRQPEFKKEEYALGVAEIFDNLNSIVKEIPEGEELEVLIGHENPIGKSANCSMVISNFITQLNTKVILGIIGPTRMSYEKNMQIVKIARDVLINA